MEQNDHFKVRITSKHRLLDLHLRETFQYRDLILLFVKRDFISLYKQTILGPLWAIIQPLLTTVVFTIIFGNLAKLTTLDIPGDYVVPSFLFYMSGNICWTYFANVLQATSNTFVKNRNTMGKVYYPRLVSPLASSISNLISFCIQLFLLFIIWLILYFQGETSIQCSAALLLTIPSIIELMILAVGCGIIISSVTTKYRDLAMLVGFGLQLWQYASPIAYGLQLIPEPYLALYMLNPVAPIIATFRYAILGFGYFNLMYYLFSWLLSILIFCIGLILFSRIERTFMDTV